MGVLSLGLWGVWGLGGFGVNLGVWDFALDPGSGRAMQKQNCAGNSSAGRLAPAELSRTVHEGSCRVCRGSLPRTARRKSQLPVRASRPVVRRAIRTRRSAAQPASDLPRGGGIGDQHTSGDHHAVDSEIERPDAKHGHRERCGALRAPHAPRQT